MLFVQPRVFYKMFLGFKKNEPYTNSMLSYVLTMLSSAFRWHGGHSVAHVQFLKHQVIMFDALCAFTCFLKDDSWAQKKRTIYQQCGIICINQIVKRVSVAPWPFGGPCTVPKASSDNV